MRQILIIVASALILTSCGANKFLTTSVTSNEITNLNYFEPLSYIHYIENGNESKLSDSLSVITKLKLDSLLTKNNTKIRLSEKISIDNDTITVKIENEINYLAQLITMQRNLNNIPLTPMIDSILESNNQRFALTIVATGFGRKKGNYGGQVAKGIGVGLLTLGMYVPTPIKSNLTLYAFIFDSQKNQVAFYKKTLPLESEPTDSGIIEYQLIQLFNGYFYDNNN
jgi:hypothetical protein